MPRIVLLLAWIMYQGTNRGWGLAEQCGGVLTAAKGVIQTPQFPRRFPTPLHCRWVVDASQHANSQDSAIVVYFTQLLVSGGLTFTEFDYYEPDSTFQLGGRVIHRVTEQNVTTVQWLLTRRHYLVIDFSLERLEGNHLRVLDGLLDVYGFNITYETRREVRNSSCSVVGCSLSGHCYASKDFKDYWCACFEGFSGPDCGQGPLCQSPSLCENGATCRQAGAAAVICLCPAGFTGAKCEVPLQDDGCEEEDGCTTQCPEDATGEPCACGPNGMPVTKDRARYEGTVRLTNVSAVRSCLESATCTLKPMLTKQIAKYLRSSNLSVTEDLRVIDVGFSGEVRFHFWGGKRDGSRVRESLNRLVQRGRLGNVSLVPTHLAITQEPTLHLQSVRVNHPRPVVRQGDEFILSCFAQGSSHMMFRWYKDGAFINITKARRNMWTRLLPLDSAEQYTALLGVERADVLDRGRYTCQVADWGYQQCKSLLLDVLTPPQVRLEPMSVTVEKGDNVTVKCTSPNEPHMESGFGYSWTKNNALFKMTPDQEFWEDLYPGGSILRVSNVQKSATYSCHVHGSVKSVSQSVRVELLNRSVVPWCELSQGPHEGSGVRWPRTGPGGMARVECPPKYSGIATRLCLLVDKDQAVWQTPDFSDCVADNVAVIADNFHAVTLGYGETTPAEALLGLTTVLRDRGVPYPGEGEPVVGLLRRVVTYINDTSSWQDLVNSTDFFYSVVNSLLLQRNFIINHKKVEDLQQVVIEWSQLWGSLPGSAYSHLAYDTLVVELFRYDTGAVRRTTTLALPKHSVSYPVWYSSRVSVPLEASKRSHNLSSSVAVITYQRLSEFLPQRFSQLLENGSEVQYEVASSLVSVSAQGPLPKPPHLELQGTTRPGWQLLCGVTQSPSLLWNISACSSSQQAANLTACFCPHLGTYAALLVKVINASEALPKRMSPRVLLVGCVCCLVQSLLTLTLLTLRWYRHSNCLLFLKLQCCVATAFAMLAFLFATSRNLHQDWYPAVSTVLQASLLVSLSSHLSKVLLVYTEVVYLPTVKYLRQTVMCIVTGVPLTVVLCNHIAQSSTVTPMPSWWLSQGTMLYYSFLSCGLLLGTAFLLLYLQVSRRLRSITITKSSDTKNAVLRRQGLLNRAALVLGATIIMSTSSAIYVNIPSNRSQYLFSFSCALLGFVLLLCYVIHCESPLHLHLLRTLKLENSFNSESDSSPLNIFTKQEAERECEGAPPRTVETVVDRRPVRNGKAEPVREAPPILKVKKSEDSCQGSLVRTPSKLKAVTFHNDLVTGCDRGSGDPVEMEVYPGSPRKFSPLDPPFLQLPKPPGDLGPARVCVITSVVVDTPSVVFCSVDVEPCSVLSQSIVHSGVQEAPPSGLPPKPQEAPEAPQALETPDKDDEGDVLDRICHDLDYLLGGLPREMKPDIPRGEEIDSSMQQTSL